MFLAFKLDHTEPPAFHKLEFNVFLLILASAVGFHSWASAKGKLWLFPVSLSSFVAVVCSTYPTVWWILEGLLICSFFSIFLIMRTGVTTSKLFTCWFGTPKTVLFLFFINELNFYCVPWTFMVADTTKANNIWSLSSMDIQYENPKLFTSISFLIFTIFMFALLHFLQTSETHFLCFFYIISILQSDFHPPPGTHSLVLSFLYLLSTLLSLNSVSQRLSLIGTLL